jgi:hypothetical protein
MKNKRTIWKTHQHFLIQAGKEPYLLKQSEFNDPICDPNLSKRQAEFLGYMLQSWNLPAYGTRISIFNNHSSYIQRKHKEDHWWLFEGHHAFVWTAGLIYQQLQFLLPAG